ncbi:holo-[acyl-carrier-protein] synthase [Wolbachia endosymbiont of Pentidionis agamae]|uniref:holo-[acyl-carrier-protein] synthase n=1 Tax=Wolbachia endosymbiont of Pentidionis agamae TaxID=3110435 RepID=UPI002FD5AC4A
MIHGIGTDIVYIPRILSILKKYGVKFLRRVYSQKEIEISKRYSSQEMCARYFAKRFAAKEAFVKALGTGFNNGIRMKEIEILNDLNGKPYINTRNSLISENNAIYLSLSDNEDNAIAFVIIMLGLPNTNR